MSLILDGTNGLSDVDGSAATPAIRGSDANTGVFFGADQVGIATNGVERVEFGNSETVFNDGGADVDFRVESDTDANALFVQGSDGNVGIGTSSPTNKLHVVGTAKIEGSTLDLNDAGTFTISQNTTSSALVLRTAASSYMRFDTNGSNERMRIDSSGNLLVGTTTAQGGTSTFAADGNVKPVLAVNNTNDISQSDQSIRFVRNASTVGSVSTTLSATAYNTSSDYRLKEAVAPMTGALARVAALKPCTYTWKSTGEQSQGFIAHELAEVVPECVTGEKDAVDAEGNPQYQGIDTSFLVATLTAAIQEQQAIITALTARVDALEGAQA